MIAGRCCWATMEKQPHIFPNPFSNAKYAVSRNFDSMIPISSMRIVSSHECTLAVLVHYTNLNWDETTADKQLDHRRFVTRVSPERPLLEAFDCPSHEFQITIMSNVVQQWVEVHLFPEGENNIYGWRILPQQRVDQILS